MKEIRILEDNKTNFTLTKNSESQNRTRHINIIFYQVYRLIENKKLIISYIINFAILVNGFTKTLLNIKFRK